MRFPLANRLRQLRSRVRGLRPIGSRYLILTVTNSGGFALYTTAAPHGRAVNDYIDVSGTTLAQYNATTQQVTAVTATTMTTDKAYTAPATGGVWIAGVAP